VLAIPDDDPVPSASEPVGVPATPALPTLPEEMTGNPLSPMAAAAGLAQPLPERFADPATELTTPDKRDNGPEPAGDVLGAAETPLIPAGEGETAASPAAPEATVPAGSHLPGKPAGPLSAAPKTSHPQPDAADLQVLDALFAASPDGLAFREPDPGAPTVEERPEGGRGTAAAVLSCGIGTYWAARLRGLREEVAGLPPDGIEA
jgi:hypothetical protein